MARWNVSRHVPILPPQTGLIVAHSAPRGSGKAVLGASYDHRLLSGFDVVQVLQALATPPKGMDAADIADDDIIPATGYLDSTAVLQLVVWYEQHYDLPLKQEEINVDNLGSIDAMADFLLARKAADRSR